MKPAPRSPGGARPDRKHPGEPGPAAINLLRSGGYGGPGFNGPVFSDDLSSMAAINSRYGVAEAVLRALQAGTDVALWITTNEVPAVLDRLEQAVAGGELAMPAVEGSVLRMAGIRAQRALRRVSGRGRRRSWR